MVIVIKFIVKVAPYVFLIGMALLTCVAIGLFIAIAATSS